MREIMGRFSFTDALNAFDTSRTGTGPDGKGVIKAMIAGPEEEPAQR
jgi:D-xylulose reductase